MVSISFETTTPSRSDRVEQVRREFPKGTPIKLVCMYDEENPVPCGTKGVVDYVDDEATIHMRWENGRTLGLIHGLDEFIKIKD